MLLVLVSLLLCATSLKGELQVGEKLKGCFFIDLKKIYNKLKTIFRGVQSWSEIKLVIPNRNEIQTTQLE